MSYSTFLKDSHPKHLLHDGWKVSLLEKGPVQPPELQLHDLEAEVPGCVHLDLMRHELIPDPFFGMNEKEVAWVAEQAWVYKTTITVGEHQLRQGKGARNQLVCEGLDTIAEIRLDGDVIGSSDNMFVAQRFDLPEGLIPGEHELEIRFASPLGEMRRRTELYGHVPSALLDERGWVRKAQYSYGWDWGPALPTSGIWRPIYIQSWEKGRIAWFNGQYIGNDHKGIYRVRVGVVSELPDEYEVKAVLRRPDRTSNATYVFDVKRSGKEQVIEFEMEVLDPVLWWPHDMGSPEMYDLELSLFHNGKACHNVGEEIGLRTIEWVEDDDKWGRSFYLKVNGRAQFAKGADWIPNDSFLTRVTPVIYHRQLQLAREMNMNMLRVWGGGIYEDDSFYRSANRLGIMIWQDFPYACSLYPETEEFLAGIRAEAAAAVQQLSRHPAIVLWCGNNEIERDAEWFQKRFDVTYLGKEIWHEILPDVVKEVAPFAFYLPSSPIGGSEPNAPEAGDRHVWNVWSFWEHDDEYLKEEGRFISEFGFQSPPDLETLREAIPGGIDDPQHPVVEWHNKQIEGPQRLFRFMAAHHKVVTDLPRFVRLTQDVQGRSLRKALEHWRRRRPRTMGGLIWQLNDCWPVESWSLVDYRFRPKASFYQVKRAFKPRAVTLLSEDKFVQLWAMNDKPETWRGKLQVRSMSFDGNVRLEKFFDFEIAPDSAKMIKVLDPDFWIGNTRFEFISAEVVDDPENTRSVWLAEPFKYLKLPDQAVSITREKRKGVEGVVVKSSVFAPSVWLYDEENPDVSFLDNALDLIPDDEFFIPSIRLADGMNMTLKSPKAWTL